MPVAVKLINKNHFKQNPELEKCVKKEIAIMQSLNHPNIVNLLDTLETNTDIILVQEFCN